MTTKQKPHGPQGPAYTNRVVCAKRGCNEIRWTKVQDAFQVKYCVTHRKEASAARRSERMRAKRAAAKKASK